MKHFNPQRRRAFAAWLTGLAAIVGAAASLTAHPHLHAADGFCLLHPHATAAAISTREAL